METITSSANPLIKQARALRQHKARAETNLFLVEGIHHVGEAVEAGWTIETILHAPELLTSRFANKLLERAQNAEIRIQPVSGNAMESLAEKENPQGILAIVQQRHNNFDELTNLHGMVALVTPQDPGNVGTILRTMDAAGAGTLFLLDGSVDLYHPTVIRASMGALFWTPVVQSSFRAFVDWARGNHVQLIATSAHAHVDYASFVPRAPWCLVMGSEQKGLSDEQLFACDVGLTLPMRGRVSSVNLAVAASIFLYQFRNNLKGG